MVEYKEKEVDSINEREYLLAEALFLAIKQNSFEIVKKLLKAGVSPNVFFDSDCESCWHHALRNNYHRIVKMLLEFGENEDIYNEQLNFNSARKLNPKCF